MVRNFIRPCKLFCLIVFLSLILLSILPVSAFADVAIDSENFPDDNFRSYVNSNFDSDSDGYLSDAEIANVTRINVNERGIASLQGVEYFTALTSLQCNDNQLAELDLSKNTALTLLWCKENQLTELDVTQNTALRRLWCSNNPLTSLDVTQNTALWELLCYSNKLTTLDVSNNIALTSLHCNWNYLAELDVSNNTALTELYCGVNNLTCLDISKNTALRLLYCGFDQLTELDVSKNTFLTHLDCASNQLTALDLSKNTALTMLLCDFNQLTALDLMNNTNLTYVRGDFQVLNNLNLTDTEDTAYPYQLNLSDYMSSSQLANVSQVQGRCEPKNYAYTDIATTYEDGIARFASYPTYVTYEYATKHSDDVIDVIIYHKPVEINEDNFPDEVFRKCVSDDCDKNGDGILNSGYLRYRSSVSISDENAISYLNAQSKRIHSLKGIEYFPALGTLYCYDNQLTALDVSKNTALMLLYCYDNQLTELDLSNNTALTYLSCYNQTSQTLIIRQMDNGIYQVDLSDYVRDISRLSDVSGNYDSTTGITTFTEEPSSVTYKYDTQAPVSDPYMPVTLEKTQKPVITSTSLPEASQGSIYSYKLYVCGYDPIICTLADGKLPTGLSLSEEGVISGIPTELGNFTFTVKAGNEYGENSKEFTLKVNRPVLEITTSSLPKGTKGAPYNQILTATGANSFTWSISSGSLPNVLSLDANTGKITGTPTESGTFKFTVKAEVSGASVKKKFSLTIAKALSISGTLKNGIKYASYTGTLKVSGGVSPYTWTISSGALPDGLTIGETTGKISGTPTKAGTFTFKVKVTDKNSASKTKSYTIKITKPSISGTLKNGIKYAAYTGTLKASNGTSPYKWSISEGTLPDGLTITEDTGVISGIPTKAGTFNFTVKATDANDSAGTKAYSIKITKTTISWKLPNGGVKNPYSAVLKAANGTAPYTWSISKGSLPNGLSLNESYGTITGTPTKAGKFSFTVKASDKNKSEVTKEYTVTITQPSISGTLGLGSLNADYSGTLTASKGLAPYTWEISKGSLPPGLELKYTKMKATISGKPTESGTYLFVVQVKDSNGGIKTKTFAVTVTSPAVYFTFRDGTVNAAYSDHVSAYGGTEPYTWTVSEGNLPDGLDFSYADTDAKLTGTPTKAGSYTFTLTAEDKNGVKASKTFTLTVKAASLQSAEVRIGEFDDYEAQFEPKDENSDLHEDEITENPQDVSESDNLNAEADTHTHFVTELNVAEDDVLSQGTDRDSDLVSVKANEPVRFIIGTWPQKVSDIRVYVDDEPVEGIEITEGKFTLPAEMIYGDFKVSVKAKAVDSEIESEELYVSAE